MKKKTQTSQVIEALRAEGGFATFKRLNEVLDFSSWGTQTPEASVRRIVQNSPLVFRIRPGLWALEEAREDVLRKFDLQIGNAKSEERFSHAYYQGLLVEIGKFRRKTTYIPAQDQNKLFLGRRLSEVSDTVDIPPFAYPELLRRAKTVDVVWFNERRMPAAFYEVEHTTDIKNSLSKFFELQDFHARFFIVADKCRRGEYNAKIAASIFAPLASRTEFIDYDRVVKVHAGITQISKAIW